MGLEDDIDLLEDVPTLHLLGREALRILAISAQTVDVRGGDELYREGAAADGGLVVVSGAVALQRERRGDGKETLIVRRGALLGETALIVDTNWTCTATAIEPTRLLRIPRTVFLRMLEGEQEAAKKLRRHVARRLEKAIDEIDTLRGRFEVPYPDEEDEPAEPESEPKEGDGPRR
jgi:CRP-like cAMP-binding protein